jgi:hypothetical protein
MCAAAALLLVGLLAGCVGGWPPEANLQPADVQVPPGLAVSDLAYRTAYAYAANRVGPSRFAGLYHLDAEGTQPMAALDCRPDPCLAPERRQDEQVAFDLALPNGTLWRSAAIVVAPNGSVVPDPQQPYFGLPDCRARPASCRFVLDGGAATRSAKRAGMKERGCPLAAQFGWDGDLQRFAWHVTDPTCPTPRQDWGSGVTIDAATGRVVGRYGWSAPVD